MKEQALMFAVFGVVENITKSELTNVAKTLIYNYYSGSERPTARERAREAVFRYAQCKTLPVLEEIRKKTKDQLSTLEHLVLRMEYEAMRIDGTLPQAPPRVETPEAEPYSPPPPVSPPSGSGPFRVEADPEPPAAAGTPPLPPVRPSLPRSTLKSGSFSGVKVKRPAASGKPRAGHPKSAAKKPASTSRPSEKKTTSRPAAKKTSNRKKKSR